MSALLLAGGAAAALGQSALFAGLLAGLVWRFAGRRPRDTIGRDVLFVQHPLLVLVLLVAGARTDLAPLSIALGIGFVVLRTIGKLLGGAIAERAIGSQMREDFGRHLLWPGVFGVAFALNAATVAGGGAGPLLGTVVLGTIGSEFVALVLPSQENPHVTRFAALLLTIGAMIAVRELNAEPATGAAATALALGFALMGASITGDVLRRFNLPRLTGYLLFGVIVGPYVGNLITESMATRTAGDHRHRDDLDRAHCRPHVEL